METVNIHHTQRGQRTLGDGMDNSLIRLNETNFSNNNVEINIEFSPRTLNTFQPIEPKCQIHNLVPKYIPKERKQPKYLVRKPKEPKFVPYEPYKGAIEPIICHKNEKHVKQLKPSRNNVEIQELVSQLTQVRIAELNKTKEEIVNKEKTISWEQWEKEKLSYETDIKNLRETNSHLENQLKFQAQVNSDLKTLLVAAVGEDLETRVQHLTEDKLQLARALLNSANHLTSHQEQTEWLSGQCEVWRSKFLASSLMVEELAHWKSALSSRIHDLQENIKGLLNDRKKVQNKSSATCASLKAIVDSINNNEKQSELPKSANVIDLSDENYKLAQILANNFKMDNVYCDALRDNLSKLPPFTVNEKNSHKFLQNPVTISNKQDAICNALMGTAMSLSGEQSCSSHATCSHCTGDINII